MKINKLIIAITTLAAAAFSLSAENNTVSPYSRFGYGLISDQANTVQKSKIGRAHV